MAVTVEGSDGKAVVVVDTDWLTPDDDNNIPDKDWLAPVDDNNLPGQICFSRQGLCLEL